MPTYTYACTACEHRFEIVQSFVDDSLTECPECAGRLRKLFNAVGVVFKGSGFYRTDSRNETRRVSAGGSSSASSSGSPSTSADSSKTSTTKTASKSESSNTSSKAASASEGSAA